MNELEKMVWAAAFARSLADNHGKAANPAQLALCDAKSAVHSLRRYREDSPDSAWLPKELRS